MLKLCCQKVTVFTSKAESLSIVRLPFPVRLFTKMPSTEVEIKSTNGSTPTPEVEPALKSAKLCDNDNESSLKVTGRPILKFAKLSENATTPTKGSESAAGFDLYSAMDCVVPARGKEIVKTDIQIAVPDGCYGRVAPRSGLAAKHFIDVGAGVIDHDYRGNVGVVMFNFSDKDYNVSKGERIAQLICEKISYPELKEYPCLNKTERGDKGYGSTGKN